jgi:predicted nucleotidyltransferase
MTESPDYQALLAAIGLDASEIPHILEGVQHSQRKLQEARASLASLEQESGQGLGVTLVAVGSIGRFESSNASDLDIAILFDPARIGEPRLTELRNEAIQKLRSVGFDVSEKTFATPISIEDLCRDVGGAQEKNQVLTYRCLVLTEGAWLFEKASFEEFRKRIFDVYRYGSKTRGRFLTSLSNDLHRYYRTLCVDYRYKIETGGKGWAIRNIKLRHSRKTWHLSNLVMQCQASKILEQEAHDAYIAENISRPPLYKIAKVLDDGEMAHLCRPLFLAYDRFLELIKESSIREELEALDYDRKENSSPFRAARANAEHLHLAAAVIIDAYLSNPSYRDYLLRYGLL